MRLAHFAAIALFAAACSNSETSKPAPTPTPPADKPVAEAKPVEIKPAQMMPAPTPLVGGGKMAHCPTAVSGANIAIMDVADAVEVTVTATDKAATDEIVTRAKHLAEAAKKDPADAKHTGEGEGGGGLGKCPVMVKDTTVTVAEVPGGAKITVKPAAPAELAALKTEVRARHTAMATLEAAPKAPAATPPTTP